jgi:exonuclease SbcC
MRIDRVILSNIGPYEHFEAEFGAGIIGVVGANGSGKSTLVNAIYAALTGDFSRLGETKADAIYNDASGKSYVEVHGTHGGKPFSVYRGLKPNKTTMSFGDTEINMTRAANEEFLLRVGVPKMIIDHYVFVDQWKMFGFLDQRESERAKVMQYLCRTEKAEQIYKAATAFAVRHSTSQIIDNSVELTQLADEQRAQLKSAQDEVEKLSSECVAEQELNRWKDAIAAYEDSAEATVEEKTALKELQESRKRRGQSKLAVETAKAQYAELLAVSEKWQAKSEKAKAARSKLLPIAEIRLDLEQATERYSAAVKEADAATVKLAEHVDPLSDEELRQRRQAVLDELVRLAGKRKELQADIANVSADVGASSCSRCRQPVSRGIVDSWSAELREIDKDMTALSKERKDLDAIDSARIDAAAATRKVDTAKSSVSQLQRQLSQLGADSTTVTIEQCDKAIAIAKKHKRGVDDAQAALSAAEVTDARREEQAKSAYEAWRIASQKLQAIKKSLPESVAEAEEILRALLRKSDETRQQLQVAKRNVENLQQQVGSTLAALGQLRAKITKHRKRQERVQLLAEVADVFHWQRLPKQVSQDNLALLVSDINSTLELFRDPFTVEATADLMFNVFFPGKPPVKATRLSGGQKVVLAVAFRVALDRLFGTDVGMLFLDEPAAGLDADNVAYFHEALQVLAARMEGQRQVVIITHAHEFSDRFDSVIEIATK